MPYLVVFVLTVFIGVLAIGLGISIGLSTFAVFLTTVASSLVYMWIILAGGGLLIERVFPTLAAKIEQRVNGSQQARSLVDRWGVPGLAVVGSIVLGPTLTLVSALLLGVDRRRFAWWYSAATVVSFAVFTALWSAILA